MNRVPLIDVTGISAIRDLLKRCARTNTRVVLCGLQPEVKNTLSQMRLIEDPQLVITDDYEQALRNS